MTTSAQPARPEFDHDVLIVGAGPVGLSLAVELGLRGVRALLIEQNARTGQQPRAKTTNVRSMTHTRRRASPKTSARPRRSPGKEASRGARRRRS